MSSKQELRHMLVMIFVFITRPKNKAHRTYQADETISCHCEIPMLELAKESPHHIQES